MFLSILYRKGKALLEAYEDSDIGKITKGEAIQSLRILMDIAKNDAARHRSCIYEPFLTKMVTENVLNNVFVPQANRLLV